MTVAKKKHRYRMESNVRTERRRWGMSQQELANRVGCARLTIVSIEHNRSTPSLLLAFDISDVFGLPISALFSFSAIRNELDDEENIHGQN